MKPTHGTRIERLFQGGRIAALVLVLAVVGTRAAESQPAALPCIQDGKANEARVNAALVAFRDALGALGPANNSPDGPVAYAAAVGGAVPLVILQASFCYGEYGVMLGEMINTTVHCDGWNGVGTPHSSGGPAAEAACQEAYQRLNKRIADMVIVNDAFSRLRRENADVLKKMLDGNPPEPLRTKARELRDSLDALGVGVDSCRKEVSTWRPPQIALQPPPKVVPPVLPTPPVLTSFDGHLGGNLAIHLDNGRATVGSAEAVLDGGVTISLRNDPSTKVSVNGHVVLKMAGVAAGAPAGRMQAAGGGSASGMAVNLASAGGPSIRTWNSLEGQGSVHISVGGWSAALGEGGGLRAGSDGVVYFGNRSFDFLGCRYDTDDTTRFETTGATMHGRLACGSILLTDSTARVTTSGRSGGGKLSLFGHTYDMTYDLGANRLKAHGRYQGPTTGWARVPGLDAEYRVSRPTADVSLDGPSVWITLHTDKVEVETVSKNRNGQPWAQASIAPDPVIVGADGSIPLRLAQLPAVQDVERAPRDVCLTAANKLPPGNTHNAAVGACNSNHPSPPSIPRLPGSIAVKVDVVVK